MGQTVTVASIGEVIIGKYEVQTEDLGLSDGGGRKRGRAGMNEAGRKTR